MKRFFITLTITMLALTIQAQNDVTTFMDVPVDGKASSVLSQLKEKGCKKVGHKTLETTLNDKAYKVNVLASKKGVYQVRLTQSRGTESLQKGIDNYNELIKWFRADNSYTEYEKNNFISNKDDATHLQNIYDKWYYAEFFQKSNGEKENYDKVVSFYLTDEDGCYKLVVCFVNRNNELN